MFHIISGYRKQNYAKTFPFLKSITADRRLQIFSVYITCLAEKLWADVHDGTATLAKGLLKTILVQPPRFIAGYTRNVVLLQSGLHLLQKRLASRGAAWWEVDTATDVAH